MRLLNPLLLVCLAAGLMSAGCEPLSPVAGIVPGAGWAELSMGGGASVTTDSDPVR